MWKKLFFLVFVVLAVGLLAPARTEGAVSDPNLALWYKLDDAAGLSVEDSSGYNRDGTIETWVADGPPHPDPNWHADGGHDAGYLAFFDETRIVVPKSALSGVSNGITVSLWVKDAWRVGQNWTFDAATWWTDPFRITAAIGTAPDAEVLWQAGNDTNDAIRWDGGNVQDLEGWHLWTFVKDETADNITIYFDGLPAASKTAVDDTLATVLPTELLKAGFVFHIGASSAHWNHLKARVDEFRVYDRALSDGEVERLYYTGGDEAVAWKPNPADGTQNLCDDVVLSWMPGDYADEHEVFFGTDWEDVNDMTDPCATKNLGQESYDAGTLETLNPGVTYYWRIDEVNDPCVWKGDVWEFTINDGNAFDPDPADGQTAVLKEAVLSWSPGCWAASHKVYFSADLSAVETRDPSAYLDQTGATSIDPCAGDLNYLTDYYWAVDEVNGATTWTGQVWTFTSQTLIIDANNTLWYKLDETEGHVAHDSSNFQNDGTVDIPEGDPPEWNPDGQWGSSLHFFDGTGLWVPTAVLSRVTNGVGIIFWANDPSSDPVLHANGGDSQVKVTFESGQITWRAGNDTDDVLRWDYGGGSKPDGWHCWAFVKDESKDTISIYLDGGLVESNSVATNTLAGVRNKPFKIGAETHNDGDFSGDLDDIIVYDRALSGNEIARQYETGGPVGKMGPAWGPSPYNGEDEVPYDVRLIWKPGDYTADTNGHDFYFGTNWGEVNDANSASDPNVEYKNLDVNTYDPPGLLDLGRSYFWRVDEVNDACDPNGWRGNVWRFTVAEYVTVDDMEDYGAMSEGWYFGGDTMSGSELFVQTVPPVRGEQSMKYLYQNYGPDWGMGFFSEVQTKNLEPNDWNDLDFKRLVLWFYGDSANASTGVEQMYVGLEDNSFVYREARYPLADINDITVEDWQEWSIMLSSFTDVNLDDLSYLAIGFGERWWPFAGGYGYVYFDDIRLYPPICVPSIAKPTADLNNDCIVDFADAEIMANEWLEADVNLGQVTKPDANDLVGWWKFEEGAGSVAGDSTVPAYNGTIEINDVNVSWVVGYDGNALEFDGGRVRVQDTAALRPMDQVSACAWIYYSERQSAGRVVVKGSNDKETFEIEVGGDDELVFQVRDGNDPNLESFPRYAAESNEDTLDRDEWIHVAGTYDGNSVRCYINGELAAVNHDANTNTIKFLSQDTNDLAIGSMCDDDRAPFKGTIDDVRVYNYGLSQAEIAYIATGGIKIFTVHSVANLYNDEDLGKRAVNFRDFAILADGWLEKNFWP